MVVIGTTLTIAALDLDPGDPLQRLDSIHVRQLSDIGCLDRVDDLIGVLLEIARRLQCRSLTGDDNGARGVRVRACTRGAGLLRIGGQWPGDRKRARLGQHRFSNRFCFSVSHSYYLLIVIIG
jgi:hypothetical protein